MNYNIQNSQNAAKQQLATHIQNRQKIKQMYISKGIQMLNRPEKLISNIQENQQLDPTQVQVYENMKNELSQYGYVDFRFLGQGKQGLVLLAKDQSTNRRYAIKGNVIRDFKGVLHQQNYDQTLVEIEQLEKCKGSPYVVNLLRKIEGKQFIFLVLNECQGTLTEIIEGTNDRKLNELTAIKYAKDIAEGLLHIHSKKSVANDLKMDNILIDYNGNAIVSDLGLADNLVKTSGVAIKQHIGNDLFKAPECYLPSDFDLYYEEYKDRGLTIDTRPTPKSESFALGYLIFVMVQGFNTKLLLQKHLPLQYNNTIWQQFSYFKQLKYMIDGLTQFIPQDRFSIKEALIILKGIICIEFKLDEKFVEVMQGSEIQQSISNFKKDIEFVQNLDDKFYPIVQNEKVLLQEIQTKLDDSKQKYEQKIEELKQSNDLLVQKLKQQEKIIQDLQKKQESIAIQPSNSQQLISQESQGLMKQDVQQMQQPANVQAQKKKRMKGWIFIEPQGYFRVQDNNNKTIGAISGGCTYNSTIPLYSDKTLKKQIGKLFIPSEQDYNPKGVEIEYELF